MLNIESLPPDTKATNFILNSTPVHTLTQSMTSLSSTFYRVVCLIFAKVPVMLRSKKKRFSMLMSERAERK